MSLFGRTLSTYKAALILVRDKQVIEARMLARSMYENLLWLAALLERKDAFVAEMLEDDALSRRSLGRTTMKITVSHGADPNSEGSTTLRGILKELAKAYEDPKKLHADKVAAMGKLQVHYVDYARLSLDSLNCSVTALGRHVTKEKESETRTVVTVNVEPAVPDELRRSTILLLCRAVLGAAIAVHDMVGPCDVFGQIAGAVEEFEKNGWASMG